MKKAFKIRLIKKFLNVDNKYAYILSDTSVFEKGLLVRVGNLDNLLIECTSTNDTTLKQFLYKEELGLC